MAGGNGGTVELDATISYHYYSADLNGGASGAIDPIAGNTSNTQAVGSFANTEGQNQ